MIKNKIQKIIQNKLLIYNNKLINYNKNKIFIIKVNFLINNNYKIK